MADEFDVVCDVCIMSRYVAGGLFLCMSGTV